LFRIWRQIMGHHPIDNRSTKSVSRRGFFKTAAFGLAASVPLRALESSPVQRGENTADSGTLERIWRQNPSANQSILLRGGTVVSLDPKVGDFAKGDVLIQGKKIASVGERVQAPARAEVIDASNTIIIPGFVDAHRHSWEGQLRRIIP